MRGARAFENRLRAAAAARASGRLVVELDDAWRNGRRPWPMKPAARSPTTHLLLQRAFLRQGAAVMGARAVGGRGVDVGAKAFAGASCAPSPVAAPSLVAGAVDLPPGSRRRSLRASARSSSNSRALWNRASCRGACSPCDHDRGRDARSGGAPATTRRQARDAETDASSALMRGATPSRRAARPARGPAPRSSSRRAPGRAPDFNQGLAAPRGRRCGPGCGPASPGGLAALGGAARRESPRARKRTAPGSRGAFWPSRRLRAAFGSSPKAASASSAATLSRNSRRNGSASRRLRRLLARRRTGPSRSLPRSAPAAGSAARHARALGFWRRVFARFPRRRDARSQVGERGAQVRALAFASATTCFAIFWICVLNRSSSRLDSGRARCARRPRGPSAAPRSPRAGSPRKTPGAPSCTRGTPLHRGGARVGLLHALGERRRAPRDVGGAPAPSPAGARTPAAGAARRAAPRTCAAPSRGAPPRGARSSSPPRRPDGARAPASPPARRLAASPSPRRAPASAGARRRCADAAPPLALQRRHTLRLARAHGRRPLRLLRLLPHLQLPRHRVLAALAQRVHRGQAVRDASRRRARLERRARRLPNRAPAADDARRGVGAVSREAATVSAAAAVRSMDARSVDALTTALGARSGRDGKPRAFRETEEDTSRASRASGVVGVVGVVARRRAPPPTTAEALFREAEHNPELAHLHGLGVQQQRGPWRGGRLRGPRPTSRARTRASARAAARASETVAVPSSTSAAYASLCHASAATRARGERGGQAHDPRAEVDVPEPVLQDHLRSAGHRRGRIGAHRPPRRRAACRRGTPRPAAPPAGTA